MMPFKTILLASALAIAVFGSSRGGEASPAPQQAAVPAGSHFFVPHIVTVLDRDTGRGVPLVELRTVNNIRYVTDRDGRAAISEPGLMREEVFLFVESPPGWEPYPADGFGYRGIRPVLEPGGRTEVTLAVQAGTTTGHWPLDEGTGVSASDFVGNNDGSLIGQPFWFLDGGLSGKSGDHALWFDGADDAMRIARTVKDDFSISFWMRTYQTGPAGTQWYHGKGLVDGDMAGTADDFGVALAGGRVVFGVGNPDVSIRSRSRVNDGAWHHVAAVREKSGRFALFVDGSPEALGSGGTQSLDAPPELALGSLQTGTNHFSGIIDEVRVYDAALAPRDVFALYAKTPSHAGNLPYRPFLIRVVDSATGRGVPLVELCTNEGVRRITDSAGLVTFFEPALMGRKVRFRIGSHGYAPLPGGGVTLTTTPGQSATVALDRLNIAERLYRVTGQGIYNHSAAAGLPVPLEHPQLCGKVMGQDTVFVTEYKGKLHWLWGDTNRPSYPLGNFSTSGATSLPPGAGGLDPSVGVDLTYHVDQTGFSKKMMPLPEQGLVWMGGLIALPDGGSSERLIGRYTRLRDLGHALEHGFAVFNDSSEIYERFVVWPLGQRVTPDGTAVEEGGYVYFCQPYPVVRVRASLAAFQNPAGYEAFTCLAPGTAFDGVNSVLERDGGGKLVWAWKADTSRVDDGQWQELLNAGLVAQSEAWNWMRDVKSGGHVIIHWGSAAFNPYRKRWIMVFVESFGSTLIGEIWYSEAPAPEGPWTKAIKIITHDDYSFYNVSYHPQFDQDSGRLIYFEGTYTGWLSGGAEDPTPRYDYNQVMYRLDLSDPRLAAVR